MDIKKGKILISEPYLPDYNFNRSVVLISEYDENGTVGFVLNQTIPPLLDEVLKLDNIPSFPMFEGGPVETNGLFYIHTYKEIKNAAHIKEDLYWGGDFDEIATLLQAGLIEKNEIKFFIGYSGWSAGQLEAEMEIGSWFISELSSTDILMSSEDTLWKNSVENLKGSDKLWANAPVNPLLN